MPGSGTNTPYKGTPRFGVPAKMLDATRNVIASIVINFIIFLVILRLQLKLYKSYPVLQFQQGFEYFELFLKFCGVIMKM